MMPVAVCKGFIEAVWVRRAPNDRTWDNSLSAVSVVEGSRAEFAGEGFRCLLGSSLANAMY